MRSLPGTAKLANSHNPASVPTPAADGGSGNMREIEVKALLTVLAVAALPVKASATYRILKRDVFRTIGLEPAVIDGR
jgi:hypothetical protein